MNMTNLKSFGWLLLKVLLCIIVINGVLSLLGMPTVTSFVTNPVGTIKGWFTKSPASSAAAPAGN
jgi:hypothetical protein